MAEERGWGSDLTRRVDIAVRKILTDLTPGEVVRYSDIVELRSRRMAPVERIAEVLSRAGLFRDDRPDTFAEWLRRSLTDIPEPIAMDLASWVNTMVEGSPRTKRRSPETAANYLRSVKPTVLLWAESYDHLRQVTRQDVVQAVNRLQGERAINFLSAARSLFRYCKVTGRVFRNPTAGVKAPNLPLRLRQPVDPARLAQLVGAVDNVAQRLIVALAAVHAARSQAIRHMQLMDVNLGERRILVHGVVRPMGDATYALLAEYLRFRRDRWPNTANRHLIVNMRTANETGPVSDPWLSKLFRGAEVTLDALRMDRILEEALIRGPDPLHLATVFGMSESAAIRYAQVARVLLNTPAELHDDTSAPESSL
ncbi:site-specific integrase [Nonomuraea polychroma]|uniref:site-specific integrase n=1 Tax=Nonomuraea polychroma TaxID=46176 RepID=UPI003D8E1A04